ncbi:hypothetical protein D4764_12G0011520 [Takifugu flavidus]|uniref:Uncharacterized protein n=1 Tax=Takifugu flavidus TaxID=433684 RepID=A0A5C6PDA9_9TELE|nr:hypothetical protein D4764_12G0011520 [Takifugu flavidus]
MEDLDRWSPVGHNLNADVSHPAAARRTGGGCRPREGAPVESVRLRLRRGLSFFSFSFFSSFFSFSFFFTASARSSLKTAPHALKAPERLETQPARCPPPSLEVYMEDQPDLGIWSPLSKGSVLQGRGCFFFSACCTDS